MLVLFRADVGTASNQWDDGKNWSDEPDVCMGNIVRDNYIRTRVRQCRWAQRSGCLRCKLRFFLSLSPNYTTTNIDALVQQAT